MARGLIGADFALNLQREMDRMVGPTLKIHEAFALTRAIQDAICPPSIRAMLEMQEKMRQLADPFGFGNVSDLQRTVAQQVGLTSSMANAMEALRLNKGLLEVSRVAELAAGLKSVLGPSFADQQMRPFAKLDDALSSLLPKNSYGSWQEHLTKSVLPSLGVLGMEWGRPVGVLAALQEPRSGASLTWLPIDSIVPSIAALLGESVRLPEIAIDVSISCAFCGETMIAHECTFRWKGNRKGAVDLTVIPICPTCTKRSLQDPEYAATAFRRLTAPALRIIKGGTTDGVRRGKLRVVHQEDDDAGKRT